MKIIHTSDWHLGRALYGRSRYQEFEAFLDWLAELIETEMADALLVSGDIFDTTTPGNRAQELYYRFLHRVSRSTCCRHVVVTGGNHDSPSFLNAPQALLRTLDVHVIGAASDNSAEEVLVLRDGNGAVEAIVCAVPYLRDRDIRVAVPGESIDDKNRKLIEGIERHYAEVCTIAEQHRLEAGRPVPIIAMGHLFTLGARTLDGDGVREIYIGSLAHVTRTVFPENIDYVALGHLHVPQSVGGVDHIRYSGSPIPMGFGEALQQKQVIAVTFAGVAPPAIREIAIPCFQQLEKISGNLDAIASRILELRAKGSTAWLEIEYSGDEATGKVRDKLDEAIRGTNLEIRRVKNNRVSLLALQQLSEGESLEELNDIEVFRRCLDASMVEESDRLWLMHCYQEIVSALQEEKLQSE